MEQEEFRFLSYNVFMRPPGIKNNISDYKEQRLALIASTVLPAFDVVCLQEMFGTFSRRRRRLLADAAARGFRHAVVSPQPPLLSGHLIDGGLVILSRFPILEHGTTLYTQSMQADALSAKGVLWAHAELPGGRRVHVFNTHLQASYNDRRSLARSMHNANVRMSQLREMLAFVAKQTARDADPILLMGDLNVNGTGESQTEDSAEYKLLMSMFAEHGLRPTDLLKTQLGYHPPTVGVVHEVDGQRIAREIVLTAKHDQHWPKRLDYIFLVDRVQTPTAAEFVYVPDSCRVEPFFYTGQPFTQLSDHYGVVARFAARSKAGGPAPPLPPKLD